MLIKLTGVDREVVEKWLYVIVGTALFSGILGTGHHYYWIGLPAYWQWIGSIFSAVEPLPFFAMVVFAFAMVWKGRRDHPNQAALLWSLGCAVTSFFGAGVLGFLHTLSFVNYYTHGTQITASHGHLAFYGAYAMVNLAMFAYAMPPLLGRAPYNQRLNIVSFWTMTTGVCLMSIALLLAGVVQTHLERVMGQEYMDVQPQLALFYWIRLIGGVLTALGLVFYLVAILVPGRRKAPANIALQPAE
jgi:nitric oxide reductase subunit B